MLLYNGKFYINEFDETAYAVLIEHGVIKDIFKDMIEIEKFNCEKIDLRKNFVFPSFHDCHVHVGLMAKHFMEIELKDCKCASDVCDLVEEERKTKKSGEWITGGGFGRMILDDAPTRYMLDEICPENPVYLYSKDIHSFWVNSCAIRLLTEHTFKEYKKYFQTDKNDRITGIIYEKGDRIFTPYIKYHEKDMIMSLNKVIKEFHKRGITAVHNMELIEIFEFLKDIEHLDMDIFYFLPYENLKRFEKKLEFPVRGVKLFLDGSLGSLTAWNYEPYTNTNNTGFPVISEAVMKDILTEMKNKNIVPAVHSIGDRATSLLLKEYMLKGSDDWRIEHAQTICDEDVQYIKNKVFSMQPSHLLFDIPIAAKYFFDREHEMYRFRTILNNNGRLLFGSDAPVDEPDVIKGIYAASVRKDLKTGNVWNEQEKISRRQAVLAYTKYPALYEKANNGAIKIGAFADLVVLSNDILKCSEDEMLNTSVEMTFYRGKKVFTRV